MTMMVTTGKLGIAPRQVHLLCVPEHVPGIIRFGHTWVIPTDTKKPKDDLRQSVEQQER